MRPVLRLGESERRRVASARRPAKASVDDAAEVKGRRRLRRMLMGVGLPLLVVLVGPALTLAIRKEMSIKIRITCVIHGGWGAEW